MSINPKFITDVKGKQAGVVLTMKEFNELIDAYEDLEDLKAYDKAKARKNEKYFSLESVKQELRTLGKLD